MERIQRALEVARLLGTGTGEAPAAVAPPPDAAPTRRGVPGKAVATDKPNGRPPRTDAPTARPDLTEAPAVTATPLSRYSIQTGHLRERRVLLADDPGAAARAYRMLRAQLLQRARSGGMRVFGVVSAVSGEGKTITAINLALSLAAEPNQNVALIDFDLRHPRVAHTLGMVPACGLETWLSGDLPPSSVLCEVEGIPRLLIAPTLAPVSASSENLASARARRLLEELKADDEKCLVILDLPPALLSDDVLTANSLVDGFILVVTEGRTRREDVERVIELLGRNRIVGTVLNGSIDSEQRAY